MAFPESSKDIVSISEGIARDIRNQYTLACGSTMTTRVRAYRSIAVKAGAPGQGCLSVRTRAGHSVPLALKLPVLETVGHVDHN
jgi:hypothetical protein